MVTIYSNFVSGKIREHNFLKSIFIFVKQFDLINAIYFQDSCFENSKISIQSLNFKQAKELKVR